MEMREIFLSILLIMILDFNQIIPAAAGPGGPGESDQPIAPGGPGSKDLSQSISKQTEFEQQLDKKNEELKAANRQKEGLKAEYLNSCDALGKRLQQSRVNVDRLQKEILSIKDKIQALPHLIRLKIEKLRRIFKDKKIEEFIKEEKITENNVAKIFLPGEINLYGHKIRDFEFFVLFNDDDIIVPSYDGNTWHFHRTKR